MVRILTSTVMAIMLMGAGVLCADGKQPNGDKPSVFLETPPAELTAKIDKEIESLSAKHPLPQEKAMEVQGILKEFKLEGSGAAAVEQQTKQGFRIREFGIRAVPVIAKVMLSPDEQLRRKALTAVSFLIKPREYITEDYAETESVLILLYTRSLRDKNPDVRRYAIGGLSAIGMQRFPSIPERVKIGLERAEMHDPDLRNKKSAHSCRVELGLTKRDPELLPEPTPDCTGS